ncbi:MAG: VCBS repeat-containing protein [Candidatus Nanoarchaeia archaeon]|jgi:hypothetical protein
MKSITPVISVILLILLTIVASVSAYFFINSNVINLESQGNLDNYPGADNSRLNLVSITGTKAIIRNDGSSPVTEVVMFVNGELLNYTLDSPILPGELREINYISQGAGEDLEIKVIYNNGKITQATSPASKNTVSSGFNSSEESYFNEADNDLLSCETQDFNWINDVNTGILSFTNDDLGSFPDSIYCNDDFGAEINVISSHNGRSKVVEIYDYNNTLEEYAYVHYYFNETSNSSFSVYLSMQDPLNNFGLLDVVGYDGIYPIALAYGTVTLDGVIADSQIVCAEDSATSMQVLSSMQANEWYKISISFSNDSLIYNVSINDAEPISCNIYESWDGRGAEAFEIASGADHVGLGSGSLTHRIYFDEINVTMLDKINTSYFGCCGDDGDSDDFYNSTNYCCNGFLDLGNCFCGDNICQAWENSTTCENDCPPELIDEHSINLEDNISFGGTILSIQVEDIDNDGADEIIVGGYYLSGHFHALLKIYNYTDGELLLENSTEWESSELSNALLYSIYVSDVDDDGIIEIITGGSSASLAQLRIWNYTNGLILENSAEWVNSSTQALSVYAYDIDNDGTIELITGGTTGPNNFAELRIWNYTNNLFSLENETSFGTQNSDFQAFYGGNLDLDADDELLSLSSHDGSGAYASLRVWNYSSNTLFLEDMENWWGIAGGYPTSFYSINYADTNNDGTNEIVTAGTSYDTSWIRHSELRIWNYTNNNLMLKNATIGDLNSAMYSSKTSDIDDDGIIEIITGGSSASLAQLRIWNYTNGLILENSTEWSESGVKAMQIIDIDDDGIIEIITGNTELRIWNYAAI